MTAPKPLGGAPDRPSALLTRRTAPAAVPWRAAMGDGDGGGDVGADGGDGDGGKKKKNRDRRRRLAKRGRRVANSKVKP